MSPLPREIVAIERESGLHANPTAVYRAVYTTRISVDETKVWLRLRFADAHLDGKSYIQISSVQDGAVQHLRAEHLWQWSNSSAYFNGSELDVTLMAAPGTEGNFLRIKEIVVGLPGGSGEEFSQCDATDDRVASDVAAVGRTIPAGCTATIYNSASCAITAGHCLFINDVFEFNVPLSLLNGTIRHPGPEDQYAIDPASTTNLCKRSRPWRPTGRRSCRRAHPPLPARSLSSARPATAPGARSERRSAPARLPPG